MVSGEVTLWRMLRGCILDKSFYNKILEEEQWALRKINALKYIYP